ncbi:sugar ABC transporter substrate-binding protein [Nakamurella leprariae]|uniref:Substrate-binding domain-containing protein n=1 Tax=Nakamurella leprariae TaxID=2803911 RepID=A0A938YA48_9ACTN|nr:substrate-binding domain-containing protein [Nakamurella leprariae]MBM9465868.1 substrate-binding domain-containing protein [Nakamurella leprariae]
MRLKTTAVVGLLAVASLWLAACGGDSGGGAAGTTSSAASSPGSSSAGGSTAAGAGGGGAVEGKIGVILPDTKSSPRWEAADRPALEKAFQEAGVEYDIQNAGGDKGQMQTIADQMITSGVTVLAIVNLDNESGAAIERKAAQQGVKTIDYDRLTLGGVADYYVSYDNTKVGELQGQGLADCLGDEPANIVFLNGSPTDSNATLFAEGAHNVLDPLTQYTQVAEQSVPEWDPDEASTIFEQMFTQQAGAIDGVLAANDTLGQAAIAILKKNGLTIPVTGQDASVQGLQNIMDGTQCMTVFKSALKESAALSELAIALASGEEGQTTGVAQDPEGDREVPAILLEPEAVTIDNVKDVVDGGGVTAAELCTGAYAAKCADAGIS